MGIYRSPVDSSHEGPAVRKASTCDDVVMQCHDDEFAWKPFQLRTVYKRHKRPLLLRKLTRIFNGRLANRGLIALVKEATDLVKSRSREIGCWNYRMDLKFDVRLDSTATDTSGKIQSDLRF